MAEVLQLTPSLNTEADDTAHVTEADEVARETDRAEGIERLKELRPDFASRTAGVVELITSVVPRPAAPGAMTKEEYQELLKDPRYRLLPFLREPVRVSLAQQLVSAQR